MNKQVNVEALRKNVAEFGRKLPELTPPPTGNLSRKRKDVIGITPSDEEYDGLRAGDISLLDSRGQNLTEELTPSSEFRLHLELYKNFSFSAVVHTHSPWATTLAVLHEPLPPVHYSTIPAGQKIPVADYATFGTDELSARVRECLEAHESSGCLIANHGLVVGGKTLKKTFDLARAIEFSARVYCQAKELGNPVELTDQQIQAAAKRYEDYGNSRQGD